MKMLDFFYVLKVVFGSLPVLGKAKDRVGTQTVFLFGERMEGSFLKKVVR
jgi:hypothetical protein